MTDDLFSGLQVPDFPVEHGIHFQLDWSKLPGVCQSQIGGITFGCKLFHGGHHVHAGIAGNIFEIGLQRMTLGTYSFEVAFADQFGNHIVISVHSGFNPAQVNQQFGLVTVTNIFKNKRKVYA